MKTSINLLCSIAIIVLIFQGCIPSSDVKVNINNKIGSDSLMADTTITSATLMEQSISAGKANIIVAHITFPAGKIRIKSGKPNLFHGEFKFTKPEWKPEISYTEVGDTGKLTMEPKSNIDNVTFNDADTCRWFVDLSPEKKYDFKMEIGACKGDINLENFLIQKFNLALGAGEVNINLKNTSVPTVEVAVGAGKAILDLTGKWNNNLNAKIAGGVGEIEIHLPKDVGVKAEVNGLLGSVDADGFIKKKNIYTNSSYSKSTYFLDLEIDGAIGKVKLVLE